MPLQLFPLLQDNTRLIRFKDTLYKVKVKFKLETFPSQGLDVSQVDAHNQIEQVFRAVLYISERNKTLKTIATPNFLIRPYKVPWSFPRKCDDCIFQQNGKSLKVFDHMFEFHVSNIEDDSKERSCEEVITTVDKRSQDGVGQGQSGDVASRSAVVMISDINSAGPVRFGRTKDGQLYRVCTGSAQINQTVTNNDQKVNAEMNNKAVIRSANKIIDNSKKLENKTKVKGTKFRNEDAVKEKNKLELLNGDKISGDRQNRYIDYDDRKPRGKDKRENIDVVKSKSSRDKYSLRESELKALDFENVQECRLRSRKGSGERVLSCNVREGTDKRKVIDNVSGSESSQAETEANVREGTDKRKVIDNVSGSESSQAEAEARDRDNGETTYRTGVRTRHGRRKTLKFSKGKRKHNALNSRKGVMLNKKRKLEHTDSESDLDVGVNDVGRVLRRSGKLYTSSFIATNSGSKNRSSPRKSSSPLTSCEGENQPSPRKSGTSNKRRVDINNRRSDEETNSVSSSQESGRSKKIKLYRGKHSPQVIAHQGVKSTVEICSPRVSTVLPLKRCQEAPESHITQTFSPSVTSPRLTRQSLPDNEGRKISSHGEGKPSQIYRDIMLQRRDRHIGEQAETADRDKPRPFYEPTVLRRSPRLNGSQETKKRRSSGLWGKIMDSFITPTKKYMFGSKK